MGTEVRRGGVRFRRGGRDIGRMSGGGPEVKKEGSKRGAGPGEVSRLEGGALLGAEWYREAQ